MLSLILTSSSHLSPKSLALCLLVGISAWSTWSSAGNLDSFYVSSDAALQAGAVVATTSSGGSIWYNPAGMSHLKGTRLDVNVSGYALRFGAQVKFDSSLPDARAQQLTLLELDVVPAAVTLTRRFGKVGVGIGIFVPSQTSVTLRTHLTAPTDSQGRTLEFGYDSNSQVREYHLGPGVGWDVTSKLCLGMSLLANYRTYSDTTDLAGSLTQVNADGSSTWGWAKHDRSDSVGVGLELVLGGQWHLGRGYTLGAVVRSPSLRLGQAAEQVSTQIKASSASEPEQSIVFDERLALGTQILSPFRFHLGLSREMGNFTASAEASLLLPFKNKPFEIDEKATFNARLGVMSQLNPTWAVGGGIYTDRSPAPAPEEFLQKKIDYYGATLAINWRTAYGIFSRGDVLLDEPHSLIFGTTLAFSYALGVGSIAGALVGPAADGGIEITGRPADVFAHEFVLHIATTISE